MDKFTEKDLQLLYDSFVKSTKAGVFIPQEVCIIEQAYKKLVEFIKEYMKKDLDK